MSPTQRIQYFLLNFLVIYPLPVVSQESYQIKWIQNKQINCYSIEILQLYININIHQKQSVQYIFIGNKARKDRYFLWTLSVLTDRNTLIKIYKTDYLYTMFILELKRAYSVWPRPSNPEYFENITFYSNLQKLQKSLLMKLLGNICLY